MGSIRFVDLLEFSGLWTQDLLTCTGINRMSKKYVCVCVLEVEQTELDKDI